MTNEDMYYSNHDLLTRNAMFNFVIGGRGTGKTYNFKYTRIRHYFKTGKQFIYLRRYKSEFTDKDEFFADVVDRFPEHEFKVDGMRGYTRKAWEGDPDKNPHKWECLCFFVTLSNAMTKKSVPYPDVDMIGYDEFIVDRGHIRYLPNEVKQFQDFYNTVDRFQDRVRVMFMANAVSIMNPYFIAWKLKPRKDQRFLKAFKGYMCVETVQSDLFRAHVDQTRFGQMIKNTAYYDYAVGNTFLDDHDKFIAKKSEDAKYYYSLMFDGRTVAIWVDFYEGIYYVSRKVPKDARPVCLTKSDMEPNLVMIEKKSPMIRSLKRLYMQGSVLFDTPETREFMLDLFDYLGVL